MSSIARQSLMYLFKRTIHHHLEPSFMQSIVAQVNLINLQHRVADWLTMRYFYFTLLWLDKTVRVVALGTIALNCCTAFITKQFEAPVNRAFLFYFYYIQCFNTNVKRLKMSLTMALMDVKRNKVFCFLPQTHASDVWLSSRVVNKKERKQKLLKQTSNRVSSTFNSEKDRRTMALTAKIKVLNQGHCQRLKFRF